MSPDDNKGLARRALAFWASKKRVDPTEVFAADYVNHQESHVDGSVEAVGLKGWEDIVDRHHTAFASSKCEVLMQIAERDLVATRWRFTVTHTGDYLCVPPTDKTISWTGVQIDRVTGGRIVESWVDWDKYSLLQGIGLVK